MLERLVAEVSEVLNKLLMASFTYNDLNQRRACCFACFLSLKHTSIFHTSGVVHTFTLLSVLVTCNASNRTKLNTGFTDVWITNAAETHTYYMLQMTTRQSYRYQTLHSLCNPTNPRHFWKCCTMHSQWGRNPQNCLFTLGFRHPAAGGPGHSHRQQRYPQGQTDRLAHYNTLPVAK